MLTVQKVLELDIIKGAKVRTAKHKVDKQPVEWVSVMDIPVENYIRKNELVLNTGAGAGNNMKVFHQFVESVFDSGASALAIATGKYIVKIPESVLEFAEEKEFPIIELPWELRFAEIVHSIMNEIHKTEDQELKVAENIQHTLLNMILGNHSLSKMANLLGEKLGFPLIIADKNGNIKGKSSNARGMVEQWNHYLASNPIGTFTLFRDRSNPIQNSYENMQVLNDHFLLFPIQTANRVQGYLIIGWKDELPIESPLSQQSMRILEHASTVLAMWFNREHAIEETKLKLRGDFVWNLANENVINWDQKISLARSHGYTLELPYVCLIGTPENLWEQYQKGRTALSFVEWKDSIFHYIQDEITQVAASIKRKTMITSHSNNIIVFLESSAALINEMVYNFHALLTKRLNKTVPGLLLSWGIGRCHEGETRFADSYKDAQTALEIGRIKEGAGCCVSFDETRMERALSRFAKDKEMREIVNQTIKALVEYDKQKNANLIETIMVYNKNQGKTSQTARDLHLHRHTLLYRLRKIEALTKLSLFNPEDRFLLELSIKLWQYGETE
ncbi:PucR family transcriptional regulator [Neobacillus thermocopriae]|uniref:PucR family transcriptional regulator n=1 Tax=Neobacillus thermocopriae TaxID=1215031 RepID=UPI0037705ED0